MRSIIVIIISLFISTSLPAQKIVVKEKLADKYYNRYSYYEAIPLYEQLLAKTPSNMRVCEKLADSYKKVNDPKNAERCYAILADTPEAKPEYLLCYAQALAQNGKYKTAGTWYQKYSEAQPDDKRGSQFKKLFQNVNTLMADSSSFLIKKMSFNLTGSDFSPAYYGKEIVFVSSREKKSMVRSLYNRTSSSYLDLYITTKDSGTVKSFSSDLNSIYHEGPVTFSKNLDTIIFTRNNFYNKKFGKSEEGINKLKLYQAVWNESLNAWTNIVPLPFNNDQFSVGHPAFTANGNALCFASDMPGSIGGTDLYLSRILTDSQGNKTWGKPENLGPEINTEGNEMFPFIDNEGSLWYASDGLPGLGGLDIFRAKGINNKFTNPANPGYPLNTRFDDFGYITQNSGKDGYLSSGRKNMPGNDDIFSVKHTASIPPPEIPKPVIASAKFILNGRVYSADKLTPFPNSTAYLVNKADSITRRTKCDENGNFSFILKPESEYSVHVEVYSPGNKCSSNTTECSTKGLTSDVTFNQSFPVFCVGDVIKVENIYYDLNKYNIRPDAALELDKLFDIMKSYPLMKIELRSHTDSRGTPASNMILSDKRANAAAEYLFSKGIARNRITGKGYGDTMPLNKCIKGVKCTEEEFQKNRRTEFKILSLE
jgi:outer membrane protein OmpA-like peptidoglycan-associated protein